MRWCRWSTQARRPAAAAGQGAAPASGLATGLHRSARAHYRQPQAQAARVRRLSARGGNCALGDPRGLPAGHQLGTRAAGVARFRYARAGLRRGRPLDRARPQEQALAAGYAVVDQTSVMATHLAEVIKQHAHELLTRQETKRLLDRLGESQPKLVRRAGTQTADPRRGAESPAATAARAGLDSRPAHDSGEPARHGRGQ